MKIRIAVAIACLISPAFAQNKMGDITNNSGIIAQGGRPVSPPGLTILDCQNILGGLTALDGHTELSKDNMPVTVSYQFGSARFRLALQQNIAALNAVQQDFTKSMQGVFKEIAGEAAEIKPGTPEMARYTRQMNDAQALPCAASLTRIKADDLKLDKNEIPGSVLGALDKILDR